MKILKRRMAEQGIICQHLLFFAKDVSVGATPEDDRRHLPEYYSLSSVVVSCANIEQSPSFHIKQSPSFRRKILLIIRPNALNQF